MFKLVKLQFVKIFHLNSSIKKHFHDNRKEKENSFSSIDLFYKNKMNKLAHRVLNFYSCNAKQEINLTLPN